MRIKVAAIVLILSSHTAYATEIDGKSLICDVSQESHQELLISFTDGKVVEEHIKVTTARDEDDGFLYQDGEFVKEEPKRYHLKPKEHFWCWGINLPGDLNSCTARSAEEVAGHIRFFSDAAGHWNSIDRVSLDIVKGGGLQRMVYQEKIGNCRLAEEEDIQQFRLKNLSKLDDLAETYKKLREEAENEMPDVKL